MVYRAEALAFVGLHLDHSLTFGAYVSRVLGFLIGVAAIALLLFWGIRVMEIVSSRLTSNRGTVEND